MAKASSPTRSILTTRSGRRKRLFADAPQPKVKKQMVELAGHIIETMRAEFDPKSVEDRYETALAELVKAKIEGRPIKAGQAEEGSQGRRPHGCPARECEDGREGQAQGAHGDPQEGRLITSFPFCPCRPAFPGSFFSALIRSMTLSACGASDAGSADFFRPAFALLLAPLGNQIPSAAPAPGRAPCPGPRAPSARRSAG